MSQEEKSFIISESTAQALLQYLVARPFNEVFQLIQAMQSLQPTQPAKLPELIEDKKEE